MTKGEKNAGGGNAQRKPRVRGIPGERGGCANQKIGITQLEQSLKKKIEFHPVLWESGCHVLLAQLNFLLVFVLTNDLFEGSRSICIFATDTFILSSAEVCKNSQGTFGCESIAVAWLP